MPFVNINVRKRKSGEYKVAILDGVRNALIETIKVSERTIRFKGYMNLMKIISYIHKI